MKAIKVCSSTLLGVGGPRPMKGGNCFSVETEGGQSYHITNFRLENFEELIRRGMISWPVEITPLKPGHAEVTDERIPEEWYDRTICGICYKG